MYRHMHEIIKIEEQEALRQNRTPKIYRMYLTKEKNIQNNIHVGRLNLPVSEEIAAVFLDIDGVPPKYDICVTDRLSTNNTNPNNRINKIDYLHQSSDPLCYPLFFPNGENGFKINFKFIFFYNFLNFLFLSGWSLDLKHQSHRATPTRTKLTLLDFYCYRLAIRYHHNENTGKIEDFSSIHFGGKLFQQLIIDYWVKVESNNLHFLRKNQSKLRVERYTGLIDYIRNYGSNVSNQTPPPGKMYILPSTFQVKNFSMFFVLMIDLKISLKKTHLILILAYRKFRLKNYKNNFFT